MYEKKSWGSKQRIFEGSNILFDRLDIVKGGFCSEHKHWVQFNKFYIESGLLKIDIHTKSEIYTHLLDDTNNRSIIVPPGLIHKFIALKETICYEIVFIKFKYNDITRIFPNNIGGILTKEELEELKDENS